MSLDNIKPDITHDATGTYCPIPITELAKVVKTAERGQIIELLADDEGAIQDVPAWCEATGNEYLGYKEEDGLLIFYIRKTRD
ncbi:MAG: sulfurtransferase TusA family protein [Persephonella sp.]|nr:MAG: sulfurtransferase TusA family protein [Persephonella sp.]